MWARVPHFSSVKASGANYYPRSIRASVQAFQKRVQSGSLAQRALATPFRKSFSLSPSEPVTRLAAGRVPLAKHSITLEPLHRLGREHDVRYGGGTRIMAWPQGMQRLEFSPAHSSTDQGSPCRQQACNGAVVAFPTLPKLSKVKSLGRGTSKNCLCCGSHRRAAVQIPR
jgi:hypothetical protein